jgi:hypothetical protein
MHVNPPPSEPSSGNTNFYPPAMEQRVTQRRPVPVPLSVQGPEQSVGYPYLLDQNDDIWRRLKFHLLVRAFPQLYTKGEKLMEPNLSTRVPA